MNTFNPSNTVVRTHRLTLTLVLALTVLFAYQPPTFAEPLGTNWIYQGRITDGGEPVNGTIDLEIFLTDAETDGNAIALQFIEDVPVADGVFSVELDFGAEQFNGDARWLLIGVRSGTAPDTDPYVFLTPRQPITAAPYALRADSVTGVDGHSLNAADDSPANVVFVDNDGNVGIGTTAPTEKLTISQGDVRVDRGSLTINQLAALTLNGARTGGINPYAVVEFSNYDDNSTQVDYVGAAIRSHNDDDADSGDLRFFTKSTGDADPQVRMKIATSGFVGIGTSNPETPLSIANGGVPVGITQGQMGGNGLEFTTRDANGGQPTRLWIEALTDAPATHFLRGARSAETIYASLVDNGAGGQLSLKDSAGVDRVRTRAVGDGGEIQIYDTAGNDMATVDVVANGGRLLLTDAAGVNRVNVQATGNGGQLRIYEPSGGERVRAYVNPVDCGDIQTFGPNGNVNTWLTNLAGSPDHGWMGVFDSTGTVRAGMYVEPDGDGFMFTDVIKINGGSDLAEPFDVITDRVLQPGMVVAIDPERVGKLRLSTQSYDRTVAGIISGAGGVKPGLMMGQKGTVADGEHPVALTGRVYCWVDADAAGAVRAGDLLTTSDTPGHAMRVTDHSRAAGAILGKAMSSLESGRGLVLVLVSLQ